MIFIDRINAANNLALLRDHPGHQSLRRAAAAALRRLPAGLDQSRRAGRATRSRRGARLDMAALERLRAARRAHARQRRSTSRASRCRSRREEAAGQAPHRPRRHRPRRCADLVRRCATASPEAVQLTATWMARRSQRAAYLASAELARGEGRLPAASIATRYLAGETMRGSARGRARGDRRTASATRC